MSSSEQQTHAQDVFLRTQDCDLWERSLINGLLKWPTLIHEVPGLQQVPEGYFENPLHGAVWTEVIKQAQACREDHPIAEEVLRGILTDRGLNAEQVGSFMWGLAEDHIARPARVNVPFWGACVVAKSNKPLAVREALQSRLNIIDGILQGVSH